MLSLAFLALLGLLFVLALLPFQFIHILLKEEYPCRF